MARNKYPEETVRRILDVSFRLFMEKGYEHTTIQDIVDELGDLSKGAVYHHFKSKEDIIYAVADMISDQNNPFEKVLAMPGLTGLEQLQQLLMETTGNRPEVSLYRGAKKLLKNPKFLALQLEEIMTITAPMLSKVIETGVADGSIQTDYPLEMAETVLILLNIWVSPMIVEMDEEHFMNRVNFLADALEKLGVPILTEQGKENFRAFFREINASEIS